jgi:6-phosphogluconolactonase/glucosamine-6-phosphate isomerase/deaminase
MEIIHSDDPVKSAAENLASLIKEHLNKGEHVFWLLSGGSGINVVLETQRLLTSTDLTNLSATLSDERYGGVGHPDENWQQLLDGGLELTGATLYRPLIGESCEKTTDEFGAWIMQVMSAADYKIGLFGIGSDGHTAGIKPHSPATEASAWAKCFKGDDFERITISPLVVSQLDKAITQASGEDKRATLNSLLHESIDINKQPAQVLKTIPDSTLFTNIKEV